MNVRRFGSELFRPRSEASFLPYIPVAMVIFLFGLIGLEDGDILGALLPYGLLFLLAILQLKFRTLIGWILLLAAFLSYAVLLAFHSGERWDNYGEFAFFLTCSLVPSAFLVYFRPRLKSGPRPEATSQPAVSKH